MNKRQKKKIIRNYHRQFCHVSYWNKKDKYRQKYYNYQCPKCGWDSIDADEDIVLGNILWQQGGFYDYQFEVEYKCPVCNTVFSYVDGN
ncbi:hypothetical protein [Anaerosacchariphilus polymeriproducens]|uniref:Uncharacterized protein n=1 Tax=Anaerosacchariphilus polymeriproducens TaxID=1812858 RepID=A0A371AZS7_9FIRM|nr:hypothetical protein [Anaerosacchariphilus polymeriproducens]RDU25043.1 hypothetical protein DWV06_01245 [Anaerosacchariphilus polymeriproducens]